MANLRIFRAFILLIMGLEKCEHTHPIVNNLKRSEYRRLYDGTTEQLQNNANEENVENNEQDLNNTLPHEFNLNQNNEELNENNNVEENENLDKNNEENQNLNENNNVEENENLDKNNEENQNLNENNNNNVPPVNLYYNQSTSQNIINVNYINIFTGQYTPEYREPYNYNNYYNPQQKFYPSRKHLKELFETYKEKYDKNNIFNCMKIIENKDMYCIERCVELEDKVFEHGKEKFIKNGELKTKVVDKELIQNVVIIVNEKSVEEVYNEDHKEFKTIDLNI
uniref:Astacin domain-containing protein n=1 Tax=Meloidogyne hapla TaxID=6305 RepID=A0A1I8BSF4_MELHA